ncbi:MAG TPA: tetratricopeptide repeat protein [Bacteroidetes bacterium]|nr:tetratricopeptide repeat protein [Bacteroidota bacterium]
MKKLFLAFLLFHSIFIFSQEDIINKAIEAYNAKEYGKAIEYYNQILKDGYNTASIYYNLANSYYNTDSLGKAMLYYEKALKLDPGNEDVKHNLYLTQRKLDSEIAELPDFFLHRWWQNFSNMFSLTTWTILTYFFTIILVVSLFVFWFKNDEKLKTYSKTFAISSLILLLVTIAAACNVNNRIYHNNSAVLMNRDTLFSAPDIRSDFIYELNPGEKMIILDSLKNWYNVELRNKEKAWIKKDNITKI